MVIGEILAGITLVNSAAEQIKKLVGNASDVSKLGKHIDDLLDGEQQIAKKRSNAHSMFSIESVAEETINMKLAQERRDEMKQLLDMRFGHGTWAGILQDRANRIQEAKQQALEAKREKQRKQDEMVHTAGISLAIIVGGALFFALVIWWSRQP
mgnify:CR=1 FL=1